MNLIRTYTAGRFIRKRFRNLLEDLKFGGYAVEYVERKYFIESDFVIKADEKVFSIINKMADKIGL